VDLGCGSESLLWAIPLRADQLTAVDVDPQRLALLRHAAASPPRPAYRHILRLCARTDTDFTRRQATLTATVVADCLTGNTPAYPTLPAASFDLVTQFGLLGLTPNWDAFLCAFTALHRLLAPGGWAAGANWTARDPTGRVSLSADLYQHAFTAAGLHPHLTTQVPVHGDPDFTHVWIYLGRKP
jgi:SAM-dependent methyltransferase